MDGLHSRVQNEIKRWSSCMPDMVSLDYEIETPADVPLIVSDVFEMDLSETLSKTRKRQLVIPRQVSQSLSLIYSYKYRKKWSLQHIGWEIGRVSHATVINSIQATLSIFDTKYQADGINYYSSLCDSIAACGLTVDDLEILRERYHDRN